jgi:hypothetical protein
MTRRSSGPKREVMERMALFLANEILDASVPAGVLE